jgi:hypothetical protein
MQRSYAKSIFSFVSARDESLSGFGAPFELPFEVPFAAAGWLLNALIRLVADLSCREVSTGWFFNDLRFFADALSWLADTSSGWLVNFSMATSISSARDCPLDSCFRLPQEHQCLIGPTSSSMGWWRLYTPIAAAFSSAHADQPFFNPYSEMVSHSSALRDLSSHLPGRSTPP